MTKVLVKKLHFIIDAESVVGLCRQAWLYENRERWAKDTLGYLAYGIGVDKIESVLNGISTLKSTKDKTGCYLAKEKDGSWIFEVQRHKAYLESKYYIFAGRKVERGLVDTYTHNVVSRLRDAMRTPGLLAIADPLILSGLEEQRRQMHQEIFEAAGFTKKNRSDFNGGQGSDEFCDFANELSAFVNNETNWGVKNEKSRGNQNTNRCD